MSLSTMVRLAMPAIMAITGLAFPRHLPQVRIICTLALQMLLLRQIAAIVIMVSPSAASPEATKNIPAGKFRRPQRKALPYHGQGDRI